MLLPFVIVSIRLATHSLEVRSCATSATRTARHVARGVIAVVRSSPDRASWTNDSHARSTWEWSWYHDNVPCRTLHVLSLDRSTPRVQVRTRSNGSRRSWTTPRDGTRQAVRAAFMGGTDGRPGGSWVGTSLRRWSMVGMGGSNSACGCAPVIGHAAVMS